jgi:FlaA1/EpsC-like NDP-sugar epimerase
MLKSQLKNPNFYLMLLADAVGIAAALVLAYAARFDFFRAADYTARFHKQMLQALPLVIALKLTLFFGFDLYRGMWRYTNLRDMGKIARAVASALFLIISFITYRWHFRGFSRSIWLLDAVFTFVFAVGLRIMVREFFVLWKQGRVVNPFKWIGDERLIRRERTIVVGAGFCGESLLRELTGHSPYEVVCCIDDDPKKVHRSLHGIRVLGGVDRLAAAVEKYRAELILIAITNIDGAGMRRIIKACEETGVPFKRIPTAENIANGRVSLKEMRDVNYEDLLGRPPVKLDNEPIQICLKKKTVLVSGAGGSIGSELCRQVMLFDPARLILVELSEYNLFAIDNELKAVSGDVEIVPVLGAIQDTALMNEIFTVYKPSVVFHAAAYKHVPMLELNPWEAVTNNITGSYVLMQTALRHKTDRFVVVSTDKAVRPTNVMGASKRITELMMQALNGNGTRFVAVRFGNVVGSSGSVVPVFLRQILRGGPVTVTHPETTRYFMTIPEAAQLILQAGALGEGGEIFVLRMGTPVRIADMARDLIRLSGKEPDVEIRIEFTGMRAGEKLHEELMHNDENIVPTRYAEIMMLRNGRNGPSGLLAEEVVTALQQTALTRDSDKIKMILRQYVPEYDIQHSGTVFDQRG